ncbi:MinD/ParA family protein [Paraferrimonas sedimenticola]|uniref:Site-determining protein n=1 Tax=Paraferrimonas sedimenticola TaxID=375674 RepID=A0AA37RQR9_9GAMM|nr:MinD/ParA family protein [Paraferrimonas sedimenticola]GLP94958.1 site-determining protein [Paraferrimonas sedimenticola]
MTGDQANGLRMMNEMKLNGVKVVAVTGGKGGVGKTSASINTAVALAEKGKKVVVLDADLGLANVDVMLGLRADRNLSHVISGECELDEVLVEGPKGIQIIPATSGTQSMVELSHAQHAGLIRAFSEMRTPCDVLIVDTAAGISDMVLSFSRASQDVLVVVCDEPTSITDAYALIKILSREHGVFRFKVVANMVRSLREGMELFAKLSRVTDRFLDVALELVATIPFDDNLRKAVRKQKLVVESFPNSPAAIAYQGLASKIISWPIPQQPGGHLEFFVERLVREPRATEESNAR